MTVSQADALLQGGGRNQRPPASPQPAGHSDAAVTPQETNDPWLLPHDGQADLDALLDLADRCAERLSPLIAVEPLDDYLWAGQPLHQPQALLMDVTGISELYGGEEALLAAAAELCQELGYQPRLAIAATAGTAWGVAHYAPPRPAAAELADQTSSPTAVRRVLLANEVPAWIIPAGAEATALDPLPIAALRVRTEVTQMLRRLGVERIGALRRLPRAGLASRLGREPLVRLDQALGQLDESLAIHHQAASHQATKELEYPTNDREILGHCLEQLVGQVAARLAAAQRGALRITCRLTGVEDQSLEIRLGLFTPTAAAEHLSRLLRGSLERRGCATLIQKVTVVVTMTGILEVRQPTFRELGPLYDWNHQPADGFADLARLIDILSERLGRQRVVGFEPTQNPLPDEAVRWRPLTGQPSGELVPGRPQPSATARRTKSKRSAAQRRGNSQRHAPPAHHHSPFSGSRVATPHEPWRRPLQLLVSPQPIHPLPAVAPATESATPPKRFRHAGKIYETTRSWGPERLETGWWRGPQRRRDYFRIETQGGQWLWIFFDLRTGAWYLHGFFG